MRVRLSRNSPAVTRTGPMSPGFQGRMLWNPATVEKGAAFCPSGGVRHVLSASEVMQTMAGSLSSISTCSVPPPDCPSVVYEAHPASRINTPRTRMALEFFISGSTRPLPRNPEDQNMLPGQRLQALLELESLRLDLGANLLHRHLVLGPDRHRRIFLPVFE